VDWSVLEYPGVKDATRKAVARIVSEYGNVSGVEFDDLLQEAWIILATHPDEVSEYVNGPDGLGGLNHWVWCDLMNKVETMTNRSNRNTSLEAIQKRDEDGTQAEAAATKVTIDKTETGGDYSRELIEQLLPAVWDSSYAFGMTNPQAPDPDMPRATIDVSHGCTLYAHLADIRTAWRKAYIPLVEKQALLLRYGMGWREREIAEQQGVSQRAASGRITRGVGRMRDYLNGVEFSE
jgi:DNA-directed RNA polymerase specialized sigma24 family protein